MMGYPTTSNPTHCVSFGRHRISSMVRKREKVVCLLVGCLLNVALGWSIGKSRIIVSKDDFKSTQPLTTTDLMDWIPWHQGEVASDSNSLDQHIESEYRKWAKLHDKEPDPVHCIAFKRNYLNLLSDAEEGHGGKPFFQLNQYGDMTQEEHRQEMLMLEAYYNWCREHNKRQDPQKFDVFKNNLLRAVSERGSLNEEIHLGEFADCLPDSKNHCIEPLSSYFKNGERFLSGASNVKQIGNGVYIEDNRCDSNHPHHDDDSEMVPTFLENMQHQMWEQRKSSSYTRLYP